MRTLLLCVALAASCGPRVRLETVPPEERYPASVAGAAARPGPEPQAPGGTAGPREIPRAALLAVLDSGPSAFLQGVEVRAAFTRPAHGGRFAGWEILAFFPGDPRFAGVDFGPGDVVVRVNGASIERPEQLMEVWLALRTAPELTVEFLRGGLPRVLHYPIRP